MAHLVRHEAFPHVVAPLPYLHPPAVCEEPRSGDLRAAGPGCRRVDPEVAHPLDFNREDTVSAGYVRDDVLPPSIGDGRWEEIEWLPLREAERGI